MKKITIALLLSAAASYTISSCRKFCPPPEKTCQIKTIQYNYGNKQTSLTYSYNNARLLTSISGNSSLNPVTPAIINITYNNQERPITGNNFQNVPYQLIYQNGRVIRIDSRGADSLFHPRYNYTYDSLGRITERIEPNGNTLRWEYEGASPNFKKMTELYHIRPGFPVEVFAVHTYEYDDKIHPWANWKNTHLNPFFFDIVTNNTSEYHPIPKNNVTHYTRDASFRGALLRSDEFFYTYSYDEAYPVTQNFLRLVTNPFQPGRVDSTRGVNYYTYECVGGNGNNHKNF